MSTNQRICTSAFLDPSFSYLAISIFKLVPFGTMRLTAVCFAFLSVVSALAAPLPGAPTILGPVTDGSQIIQVTNLLPDVIEVIIKDVETGVIIAQGSPTSMRHSTGLVSVTLVSNLVAGNHLTATQQTPSGTSPESPPNDIEVLKFHNPGPPTITSLLHTCMTAIQVSDVVVGARIKVSTRFPPTVIGETTATDTAHVWVDLDLRAIFSINEVLTVSQEVEFNGASYKGETLTEPLKNYEIFMGVSDREIYIGPEQQLSECQTEIHFLGGIPGVKYSFDNEGAVGTFDYGTFDYYLRLAQPLKAGKLIITSPEFPDNCGKTPAKSKQFIVATATSPGVPTNMPAPCPDSHSLIFEGLVSEGTLIIVHDDGLGDTDTFSWGNGNGGVPLPSSWNLVHGLTTFYQVDVCDKSSGRTGKVVPQHDTSGEPPKFLGDLYECSSFIAFSGLPGTRTTVLQDSGSQLSTPSIAQVVFVDGSEALVVRTPVLWEKLYFRETILLRQEDCGSKQYSGSQTVKSLPEKLFTLQFDPPTGHIYTTSRTVTVTSAFPGALIQVFADGIPVGQAEAYSDRVTVPIGGPHFPSFPFILESGQVITAIQYFYCDARDVPYSSEPQSPGITVTGPPFEGIVNEAAVIGQKGLKEL
jgi:hypothetical protein